MTSACPAAPELAPEPRSGEMKGPGGHPRAPSFITTPSAFGDPLRFRRVGSTQSNRRCQSRSFFRRWKPPAGPARNETKER